MRLISYIRTSTAKQSLGLEAQQAIIEKAAAYSGHEIVATFIEQLSGKDDSRAKFLEAIEACKAEGASLAVAKIDRLARHAAFAFFVRDELEKEGLSIFEAESNRVLGFLEFGFKVVFAQDEAKKISQRTKEALAVKKAKGEKLGSPKDQDFCKAMNKASVAARRSEALGNADNKKALAFITLAKGLSLRVIAEKLNEAGFTTARGGKWTAMQVSRLKDLATQEALGGKKID